MASTSLRIMMIFMSERNKEFLLRRIVLMSRGECMPVLVSFFSTLSFLQLRLGEWMTQKAPSFINLIWNRKRNFVVSITAERISSFPHSLSCLIFKEDVAVTFLSSELW